VAGARRSLQDELKQSKPFESPSHEAMLGLWRTADHLRRVIARPMERNGITLQQYNVLRILRGAGPEGLPTLDIADRMIEQTPGITRLLDRLERKHLIARRRCPEDRRQVLCTISPAGLELLTALDAVVREAQYSVMSVLNQEETTFLIDLLERIRTAPEKKE
jgi:DNA-binding MarR family transcriptional regulator